MAYNDFEHEEQGGCSCGCCSHGHNETSHSHQGEGCGCGHEHEEGERKGQIIRLIVSVLLTAVLLIFEEKISGFSTVAFAAAFLVPYLIAGGDVLLGAVKNILKGKVFDEQFLMSIATIGAFATGEYTEAVAVMVFYKIGELFEDYAVDKSHKSIAAAMDLRPDYANVMRNETVQKVSPEEVSIGEIIVVKPGEKIPLDGVIVSGESDIDTSALTGESQPRSAAQGDSVLSGFINMSGLLKIEVTKAFHESTVAKILELVESSSARKTKTENFITKFARYYTPAVVIGAALLFIIPSIVTGQWREWLSRALIFLVVSCPCALVVSVPLSFFGGIGGASRQGILIKGSNYIDALSKAGTVVFDKTGTLTKGTFKVTAVQSEKMESSELLRLASAAESCSNHPIARSVTAAMPDHGMTVTDFEELGGKGICARIDGRKIWAGNERLMNELGIKPDKKSLVGTVVHIAEDGEYLGSIEVTDEIKQDAAVAIEKLKKAGVKKTVMLTGDNAETAKSVADALGLDEFYAGLLPDGKVEKAESLLGDGLVFVGDGINDAPVLARADIGVAMGGAGSDAAIEAADVVIMDDKPEKVATAIRIAKKTMGIVKQNIVFALGVKGVVLVLGALGIANMWLAVFADVGVAALAIINAMRALKVPK